MPVAVHIVGAPHTGTSELFETLVAELGSSWVHMHPLMRPEPRHHSAAPSQDFHAACASSVTLLTGLDWPCPPTEQVRREEYDAELRRRLAASGTCYRVLYGSAERRLACALAVLGIAPASTHLPVRGSSEGTLRLNDQDRGDSPLKMRSWGCEKCSDPVCEHRLFTSLRLGATR